MANPILEALGFGTKNYPEGLNPKELIDFIRKAKAKKGPRNKYIDIGPYSIYTQVGPYGQVPSESYLNIANISNKEKQNLPEANTRIEAPESRGPKGRFKELMALIEQTAAKEGLDGTYVEQAMNDFLPEVLGRYGYIPANKIGERSYRKPKYAAGKMEPHRVRYAEGSSTDANDLLAQSYAGDMSNKRFEFLSDAEETAAITLAQKIRAGEASAEERQMFDELLSINRAHKPYDRFIDDDMKFRYNNAKQN